MTSLAPAFQIRAPIGATNPISLAVLPPIRSRHEAPRSVGSAPFRPLRRLVSSSPPAPIPTNASRRGPPAAPANASIRRARLCSLPLRASRPLYAQLLAPARLHHLKWRKQGCFQSSDQRPPPSQDQAPEVKCRKWRPVTGFGPRGYPDATITRSASPGPPATASAKAIDLAAALVLNYTRCTARCEVGDASLSSSSATLQQRGL